MEYNCLKLAVQEHHCLTFTMSSGDNDAQGAVVEAQNVYEMIPTNEEEIMPSVPTKGAKDSIPEDCIYESMPCDHIQMHSEKNHWTLL